MELLHPSQVVVHVHSDIGDQRFLPILTERLKRTLAPPIYTLPTDFELGALRATGSQLDGQALVAALAGSVDWSQSPASVQVLLIEDDIRLRPARYNFAVSAGTASTEYHVVIVSLARLQARSSGDGPDRDPARTAERVFKLVAKNTAKVAGYGGSTLCLFDFPRSLRELDALPEGFCEPDLSALIAAGIARSLHRIDPQLGRERAYR